MARFGDAEALPSVDKVKATLAARMTDRIKGYIRQAELEAGQGRNALEFRRSEMAGRHREERKMLREAHEARWTAETNARAAQLPRGFSGIWQRITGKYGKIREQNERTAWAALLRDRAERDDLVATQLDERRDLQHDIREQRERQQADLLLLREDVARYQEMALPERTTERREQDREGRQRTRGRDKGRDFGFER